MKGVVGSGHTCVMKLISLFRKIDDYRTSRNWLLFFYKNIGFSLNGPICDFLFAQENMCSGVYEFSYPQKNLILVISNVF